MPPHLRTHTPDLHLHISALSTQMAAIMEEVKKNRIDRYRAQSRSPSPRKGDKQGCFHCGAMGHFKRECPRLGSHAQPGLSPVVRPWRYLFHLPSRITPKGGPKYSLIIMLEPPHFINSLLYVFRSDIRGITPGLFICCPLT
jgi:hypothetical protein